jgi:type IV secretory pathway TraG/TraD family ATPase VirD4
VTTPRPGGVDQRVVSVLDGMRLLPGPPPQFAIGELLSTHILFLGGIGTGKTNGMKQIVRQLRAGSREGDVFIFFDTKGDFLKNFRRPGDAVISSDPDADPNGVRWNLFRDLPADPRRREEDIYEIATAVFGDELHNAGQNTFFAAAARDIFAGVVAAMADQPNSNDELRTELEGSADQLYQLLDGQPGMSGTIRYLEDEKTANSILAFLQLTLRKSFSGAFRERGDFSVRDFVRGRGGRALFVEYDIAVGSSLLPIYRVLIDMAIKEALASGRSWLLHHPRVTDNFYFILDEFALLPRLSHIADGVNFGRELGLKFLVATQNVNQVLSGYSAEFGQSIMSGFGTIFAFRLPDEASRTLLRQRYGTNRKKIAIPAAVRHEGVQETIVVGNVIEDWDMSGLEKGHCIAALPHGAPFLLQFAEFKGA